MLSMFNLKIKIMKHLLLSALAISMLFVGCTKADQEPAEKASVNLDAPEVVEFSTDMLEFASMEEMQNKIYEVADMTPQDKQSWYSSNDNFVSQSMASNIVGQQMAECSTIEQAIALRDAYDEIFVFDPNTREVSMVPYVRAETPGYAWMCNAYGDVKIGGKVVNLNNVSTYAETSIAKATDPIKNTRARNTYTITMNGMYGNIKSTVESSIDGQGVAWLKYSSKTLINSSMYVPSPDTFTISRSSSTNLNAFTPVGNYYYVTFENSRFDLKFDSPSFNNNPYLDRVGNANTPGKEYAKTGFTVYSAKCASQGNIMIDSWY